MTKDNCISCGASLACHDFVVCRQCGEKQHKECWTLATKCSAPDCPGKSYRAHPEANADEARFSICRPFLPDDVLGVLFLATLLILVGLLHPYKAQLGKGGGAAVLFCFVYGFIALGQLRWKLTFDDLTGTISRQLLMNVRPLTKERPWLLAHDIAIVEFHEGKKRSTVLAISKNGHHYRIDFTGRFLRTHYHDIKPPELAPKVANFANVELTHIKAGNK